MFPIGSVVPMVVEQGRGTERAYDIYSLLLKERIVMLGAEINPQTANLIVAQLLYLDREDPDRAIKLYIHSPGGEVYSGLAIYDAMQQVQSQVSTFAVGRTASFGTIILTAGETGLRYALPHATVHMHQPLGGAQGQVSDIMIVANEYQRLKNELFNILVKHSGKDRETIEHDADRDFFLTAQDAVNYGLIDSVVDSTSENV